jgi:hypothetical protein
VRYCGTIGDGCGGTLDCEHVPERRHLRRAGLRPERLQRLRRARSSRATRPAAASTAARSATAAAARRTAGACANGMACPTTGPPRTSARARRRRCRRPAPARPRPRSAAWSTTPPASTRCTT